LTGRPVVRSGPRRFGPPDEVARAGVFLASDDSSDFTGTEWFVDGGVKKKKTLATEVTEGTESSDRRENELFSVSVLSLCALCVLCGSSFLSSGE
jgi:hypothetical protein